MEPIKLKYKDNNSSSVEPEENISRASLGNDQGIYTEYVAITSEENSSESRKGDKRIINLILLTVNKIVNLRTKIDNKITYLILDVGDWLDRISFLTGNIRIIDLIIKFTIRFTDLIISAANRFNKTRRQNLSDSSYTSDRRKRLQSLAQKEHNTKRIVYLSAIISLICFLTLGIIVLYGFYIFVKDINISCLNFIFLISTLLALFIILISYSN